MQPYPGTTGPHPRIRNPLQNLQPRQPGDENGDPPGRNRPVWCGNPSPTGRSLIGWGSYIEPAHPGGDRLPSPGKKSFYKSTTPTTRGRKRISPGSIPPRRTWKPQPDWMIADWLGLMEPARGKSRPSGQRRGPAAPGEDHFPSPDHKYFHISTTQTTQGTKTQIPRFDTASRSVETPTPLGHC